MTNRLRSQLDESSVAGQVVEIPLTKNAKPNLHVGPLSNAGDAGPFEIPWSWSQVRRRKLSVLKHHVRRVIPTVFKVFE
jgi:hypothetical protein